MRISQLTSTLHENKADTLMANIFSIDHSQFQNCEQEEGRTGDKYKEQNPKN